MKSTKVSTLKAELPAVLLQPRDPEMLRWEMQAVQLAIARRAFELFEKRGGEHGHDWEDWFQAESELLRPVSVAAFESGNRLSLRANVFGFEKTELQVSIEPKRVVILGNKVVTHSKAEAGKLEASEWYPDQILRLIDLPTEVHPEGAVVELQAGILKFELVKAANETSKCATATA
jgi:HSP20 family molecular chaperone IbpA